MAYVIVWIQVGTSLCPRSLPFDSMHDLVKARRTLYPTAIDHQQYKAGNPGQTEHLGPLSIASMLLNGSFVSRIPEGACFVGNVEAGEPCRSIMRHS